MQETGEKKIVGVPGDVSVIDGEKQIPGEWRRNDDE